MAQEQKIEQQIENNPEELSDEEAIFKIAQAMKDTTSNQDEKHNVHVFLHKITVSKDTTKVGFLKVDKDIDELGIPEYSVRGCKEMALISEKLMNNNFFKEYFEKEAENILATSLSREGFLVRQASTQTKQVADVTRRMKTNKGWFGKKTQEVQGGDITTQSSN